MSSFFTIPGAQNKRKRPSAPEAPKKRVSLSKASKPTPRQAPPRGKGPASKPAERDEEISGSDSDDDQSIPDEDVTDNEEVTSESEGEVETAAEKRLRLAERYLENVRREIDAGGFDAAEIDKDLIAERLQEDAAETKGKVYRQLASELGFGQASHTFFRSDTRASTSVAVHAPHAYVTTKDLILQKWRIQDLPRDQYPQKTKKKPKKQAPPKKRPDLVSWLRGSFQRGRDKNYMRHTQEILATAVSSDGKFVATGGADKRLIVYDGETLKPLKVFTQHRSAVTGVAFRRGTHQLYSCSRDRTVKVWSLDELAYVETLFGHGDEVVDIDALGQERCVSVGARDRTARLWRVADETQLVYRGGVTEKKSKSGAEQSPDSSMDRVAMIDDDLFVTASDNGSIALWHVQKKKPLSTVHLAHGLDPPLDPSTLTADKNPSESIVPPQQPRWITALCTVPYSDLILSGSWDGCVRAWKLSEDKRQLLPVGTLGSESAGSSGAEQGEENGGAWTIPGVVNDIAFFERGEKGRDGLCVVAAIGKEHRFGRWMCRKGGKNGAVVFEVPRVAKVLANGVNGVHSPDGSD